MPQENLTTSELTITGAGADQVRMFSGNAAPTRGSFLKGDMVINAVPAEGAPLFWRCLASGYPGTWEEV